MRLNCRLLDYVRSAAVGLLRMLAVDSDHGRNCSYERRWQERLSYYRKPGSGQNLQLGIGIVGHKQDFYVRINFLDFLSHPEPIHYRHDHISENETDPLLMLEEATQPRLAVFGD